MSEIRVAPKTDEETTKDTGSGKGRTEQDIGEKKGAEVRTGAAMETEIVARGGGGGQSSGKWGRPKGEGGAKHRDMLEQIKTENFSGKKNRWVGSAEVKVGVG